MSMEDLQAQVAAHDQHGWLQQPGFDSFRHNVVHMGKTLGKLLGVVEEVEDGRKPAEAPFDEATRELAANALIEALRLANIVGIDAETAVPERLAELRARNEARATGT